MNPVDPEEKLIALILKFPVLESDVKGVMAKCTADAAAEAAASFGRGDAAAVASSSAPRPAAVEAAMGSRKRAHDSFDGCWDGF